jgi:hypothetical protein
MDTFKVRVLSLAVALASSFLPIITDLLKLYDSITTVKTSAEMREPAVIRLTLSTELAPIQALCVIGTSLAIRVFA